VKWLVAAGCVLYIAYGVFMVSQHTKLIYPFSPEPFEDTGYLRHDLGADGPSVYIYDAGADAPVVFYFMGNNGALPTFVAMLDHHKAQGRSVIALGYRGGGGLPGQASETILKADALQGFDAAAQFLAKPSGPIVIHGFSLGTGLALHVAANREVDAVVLSAPYQKLCRLMAQRSYLPACYLPGVQKWHSDRDAATVTAPVLVQTGTVDKLIPLNEGRRLFAALENSRDKTLVEVHGAGHSNLLGFPAYLDVMDGFIGRIEAGLK